MLLEVPPTIDKFVSTHSSRTLMLEELRLLFDAVTIESPATFYARAVLEDNALHKKTSAARNKSLRFLKELYSLTPSYPLFLPFRALWEASPEARPLLALMMALVRDRILRSTLGFVLELPLGTPVNAGQFSEQIALQIPGLGDKTLASSGRNVASTWTQSGHLGHTVPKTRIAVQANPAVVAFALLVGHLQGVRGIRLLETPWIRILDTPLPLVDAMAFAASQQGWMEYKRLGEVAEFGFRRFEILSGGNGVSN